MKMVYIAHPLNAPTAFLRDSNRHDAKAWVYWAAYTVGVAPVATWITLSDVADAPYRTNRPPEGGEDEKMREKGLAIDVVLVKRCDEMWLVGGRISTGMRIEADAAIAERRAVVDLTMYEKPGDIPEGLVRKLRETRCVVGVQRLEP